MKKKLLLGAVSAAAVAAPIAAVVSCSVNDYGQGFAYYGSVQTITDAGSVADKSFNESAFEASKDYAQGTILDSNKTNDQTFGYSQPKSTTRVLLQKAYLSALKKGAKRLVLPGFTHSDPSGGDAIDFAIANKDKYPDTKYISIDGFADDSKYGDLNVDSKGVNVVGIAKGSVMTKDGVSASDQQILNSIKLVSKDGKYYKEHGEDMYHGPAKDDKGIGFILGDEVVIDDSLKQYISKSYIYGSGEAAINKSGNIFNLGYWAQESGFLAAIYTGMFFNQKHKVMGDVLKVATFGGTAIPYGVTSYMDGWLSGIKYFNDVVVPAKPSWAKEENIFSKGNAASMSDFTGSFDAGAATSKVQSLLDEGVQAILPVAGPQTGDVTGLIKKNNLQGKVYAMGVDVDQAPIYGDDVILGSAVKGIYGSTLYALNKLEDQAYSTSFPSFNHALESNAEWIKAKGDENSGYVKQLMDRGMTKQDAINKLMFTGFIPSKMSGQLDLTGDLGTIYKTASESGKASNKGAFLEVANA